MYHNNWNLFLQNCMARSDAFVYAELVLMKGTPPELSMAYSEGDVNLLVDDRHSDWIARYSVVQQDFAFLGGVSRAVVEERDGRLGWSTLNFLYESDMDNNADRVRTSFQADTLLGHNEALPTDAVTLPTWFVLIDSLYGPGTANVPSGHVIKLIGKVASYTQPDASALLTLRSEPVVGQPPLAEELAPVKLPF